MCDETRLVASSRVVRTDTKEGKTLPCIGHDKQQQIDEQVEKLRQINMQNLEHEAEKAGLKFDGGKLRFDLYPIDAYKGCTQVLTFGAKKYTPNGWRSVPDAKNRYYAALIRHLNAQKEYVDNGGKGLSLDDESGLPHLDHAQCCLVFLRELSK